jgi:hypothetical protein
LIVAPLTAWRELTSTTLPDIEAVQDACADAATYVTHAAAIKAVISDLRIYELLRLAAVFAELRSACYMDTGRGIPRASPGALHGIYTHLTLRSCDPGHKGSLAYTIWLSHRFLATILILLSVPNADTFI